jgi:drug/metabolite transporter (DMT)-like permease
MDRTTAGLINGLIGVVIFSASLVATRLAVIDLDPLFLTYARASNAALAGGLTLLLFRQPWPRRGDLVPLAVTSAAVVVGFPVFSAYALQHIGAARATLYIGLLPLMTAAIGVLRIKVVRPRPAFWLFAVLGSLVVMVYALADAASGSLLGDGMMVLAVVSAAVGYAEGARLTARLGGWQVISWALLIALPIMLPLTLAAWPDWSRVGLPARLGLGYVSLFSMWIGFIFWYRGLAQGGIAAVSQLQLLQPFLGLILAALVLGETVSWRLAAATVLVVACVGGARRLAVPRPPAVTLATRNSAPATTP